MRTIAISALAVWLATGALAQEPAPPVDTLDGLLEQLSQAEEDAARRLERSIIREWSRSGSDSMDHLLNRGRAALQEEAYDKALDHFTAITELSPEFVEGWNMRATVHFHEEQFWLSMADIQRTLALEPRHFGALIGMAAILERTGDEAGALRAARAVLEINPHSEAAATIVERLAPKVDGQRI